MAVKEYKKLTLCCYLVITQLFVANDLTVKQLHLVRHVIRTAKPCLCFPRFPISKNKSNENLHLQQNSHNRTYLK